jgi:hypothetical protein
MKHEDNKDNIVDYINGHLSDEQSKEFERELDQNPTLMKELNEAKNWQSQLQSAKSDIPMPQFSSIESKLKRKTWNLGYGLPTAAAIAIVTVLYIGTDNSPNNEFETLTDTNSSYSAPIVQIVLSDDVNISDFANEYGLSIIETYPNNQIIDVEFNSRIEQSLSTLKDDERTVLVKKIGTN